MEERRGPRTFPQPHTPVFGDGGGRKETAKKTCRERHKDKKKIR